MDVKFDTEELARRFAIAYASWAAGLKGIDSVLKKHRGDNIGEYWLKIAEAVIKHPPGSTPTTPFIQ